jgi:probable phosphoglycerate mutase
MIDYFLAFDGGSRGNPGQAYGSFRIHRKGSRATASRRLRFGRGTNNEAEYWALLAGLRALLARLGEEGTDPQHVRLEIRGDSLLVIRQLQGEWKAKDARMRELRDQARRVTEGFGGVRLVHQERSRSVAMFGH